MRGYIPILLTVFSVVETVVASRGSPGCGKPLPNNESPGKFTNVPLFMTSDNVPRSYIVNIPSGYNPNKPAPLIFSFHGRGKTAYSQLRLSAFYNETWNPDAISVYPQGLKGSEGEPQWQGDPNSVGVNDVGFVLDMINSFSENYCIDTDRIFASGKSNGGGFTGLLACDETASKSIAAFAPVSGAYYQALNKNGTCDAAHTPIKCSPAARKIPILEFHGDADHTIPYDGGERRGECLPTIPHWAREWSKRDGYGPRSYLTSSFDNNVLKYEYGNLDSSLGIVTHYMIRGLGHAWPSTQPNSDNPNGTYIDATPLIMDFFSKYPLH
ncbi:ferulic acid esterase (FaeA), putative [Paecilomyces variotii No. 5]|uniref:feruloyl esterase n=1 Tax=Byssochlamys spectabilis (strain No. 5 / NBRC 109023) TaxID=1356009 RepID=V5GBL0_BYSSN|nr:ferulic acid esterase (FaeA), putative [Paecilomyces variotii No. 5]